MPVIQTLEPYSDKYGNVIETHLKTEKEIRINFRGRNNRLVIGPGAKLRRLHVTFDCDDGLLQISASSLLGGIWGIRVGQNSTIKIGSNVTTTGLCILSSAEGADITIGRDVMIATGVQIRADDGHPIFDVETGNRVNPSRSIIVGNHVWLATRSALLPGSRVGNGSVIGLGSVVTSEIPNNVVAAGSPARVVRRNIAWERPHLTLDRPYFKPDSSQVIRSEYWSLTKEAPRAAASWRRRLKARFWR